jgi:hypothetical protein
MNISSGTYYWLCAVADAGNLLGRSDTGGTAGIDSATFSSWTWPETPSFDFSDFAYIMAYYLLGETGGGVSIPVILNHLREG